MKQLLDTIIEATFKANSFFSKRPIRPAPGPPASPDELRQLDAFLAGKGLQAPPGYRSFLSVYNGIENLLAKRYSLLSIEQVIGGKYELLEENEEEYPHLCQFVLAAGNTSNFMGFDIRTPASGNGYEVAEITAEGKEWRYASFAAFLQAYLANTEQAIREEEADRANLKP